MSKRISKIMCGLLVLISIFFVGNIDVRADEDEVDISVVENMITKSGGKETCPDNSYVCLMGISAVRITYYEDGNAKNGYNVFDTKKMSQNSWNKWLDGLTQNKTTRYGTAVSHRKFAKITSVSDWRLDTKNKQSTFYSGIKKSIKNIDPWVVEIINLETGNSFATSGTDANLKTYVSEHKVYFVIEPLYFFKVQDLETADKVGFGQLSAPQFRKYLYTANQIGEELIKQTNRCKSGNYGTFKCASVYEERIDHPHTKKIATNMYLKKDQLGLKKAVTKNKYNMKDLRSEGTKTGLGVGVVRLKYKGKSTTSPDYRCFKKESSCDNESYSITADVSSEATIDATGATCSDKTNYSDSEYGVITFLEDNPYCHVYCKKNIEFDIPSESNAVFKTPWATVNSNDNFVLTKTGSYDCKVDFEYFYGDYTNSGWIKDTAVATYGKSNRITKAQALLAQTLENVRTTRDELCNGKTLEECKDDMVASACPGDTFENCVSRVVQITADKTPWYLSDKRGLYIFRYNNWLQHWADIKDSYAECANFVPDATTIFPKNKITVNDTDGNSYELEPEGTTECNGDCDNLHIVDYGTGIYVNQPLPGNVELRGKTTTDVNGNTVIFNDTLQNVLAATSYSNCANWKGNDGITKGSGYNSICLLKRFYEFYIESRDSFSIDVNYTYKPTKYYTANFNLNSSLNDTNDPTKYNSFSNKSTQHFGTGSDNVCKWNSSKFYGIIGLNTDENGVRESVNKITFDLSNETDAASCNFSDVNLEMKKSLSTETCACPASTKHAGTSAYYWINNNFLTNSDIIQKFKDGVNCAEAISLVCRDDSLTSDPDGYEEPVDLNGKPITDCLIAGIPYQKCIESGSRAYKCKIKNQEGNEAIYYINVYKEAAKRGIDITNESLMNSLSDEVCREKYGTCNDNNNNKFVYRTVQMNDGEDIRISFPGLNGSGRSLGSNWSESDAKIVLNRNNVDYNQEPMYKIVLDLKTIKKIREYNKKHSYDDFNMNCNNNDANCVSKFLNGENGGINGVTGKCANVTSESTSFYGNGCVNYYKEGGS